MLITKVPLLRGYISSLLSLKILYWKLSKNGFHCTLSNKKKICMKLLLAEMELILYLKQSKNKIILKCGFQDIRIKHQDIKDDQH